MDSEITTATEHLIHLLNLDMLGIDGFIKTSDGHFLGRRPDDIGYNLYIGQPSPPHPGPGLNRTLETWDNLTGEEQSNVQIVAAGKNIDLSAEFGIPVA